MGYEVMIIVNCCEIVVVFGIVLLGVGVFCDVIVEFCCCDFVGFICEFIEFDVFFLGICFGL